VLRFYIFISLVCFSLTGVAQEAENPIQYCNRKGHALCVKITAKEVFEDGSKGKWSRHWKRMSYIGKACVSEHGEEKGKALEAVFAPGHYFAMFWVNVAGLTKYGFSKKEKKKKEAEASLSLTDK
jgi:hypothetical protein